MKYSYIKSNLFTIFFAGLIFVSCNKDVEQFPDNQPEPYNTQLSGIADTLASPARANNSLYSAIVVKAGMTGILNDSSKKYTIYVPTNAAVKTMITLLTGGVVPPGAPDAAYLGFIQSNNFPQATAQGIVSYNTLPGIVDYTNLGNTFPNRQLPSLLNPKPELSALLRLTIFPSARNGNFVNNVPVVAPGIITGNGVIHEVGAVVAPPQRYLWDRINTDPELTYLKAAIIRADSGSIAGNPTSSLVAGLQSIGANLTILAPVDDAFKATLYQLALPSVKASLYAQARANNASHETATAYAESQAPAYTTLITSTPDVFSNPAFFNLLTARVVKGVVAYHILTSRAFSNNFPATQTNFPTLLNSELPTHPGVGLQASFTGPIVTAATVKGLVNPTAAMVRINPNPEPAGSSDQHYLNGALHKINQVLLPQSF